MTAEHNHPPRCCCELPEQPDGGFAFKTCPGCPDHGMLAAAANPVECPQCHQPAGRPHTEYCTLDPARVWANLGDDVLKTPAEWAELEGGRILDADGWRSPHAKSFDEPISQAEYELRRASSTCSFKVTTPADSAAVRDLDDDLIAPQWVDNGCRCPNPDQHQPGCPANQPTAGPCPDCGVDLAATADECTNPNHRA